MSLGPIMMDLRGPQLAEDERDMLRHPLVGGVILFSRNFVDIEQLQQLTGDIHALRQPQLLVAVDHEGGRVQRFRQGFTNLPPGCRYGELYDEDRQHALARSENAGWLLAVELLSTGVDLSFAPVLDLRLGVSEVIGDRAFHHDPDAVTGLAKSFCRGMKKAGMAAVGKHFPGHGSVSEDSHDAVPHDGRRYEDIAMLDMLPFERLIPECLQGIMPAHVIFTEIDDTPAGFSRIWLGDVLRGQLGFQGAIFSDDVSMAGAEVMGGYTDRARAAISAGCDMVLVCNNQEAVAELLDRLNCEPNPASQVRLIRMHGQKGRLTFNALGSDPRWKAIRADILSLEQAPELDLGDDGVPG